MTIEYFDEPNNSNSNSNSNNINGSINNENPVDYLHPGANPQIIHVIPNANEGSALINQGANVAMSQQQKLQKCMRVTICLVGSILVAGAFGLVIVGMIIEIADDMYMGAYVNGNDNIRWRFQRLNSNKANCTASCLDQDATTCLPLSFNDTQSYGMGNNGNFQAFYSAEGLNNETLAEFFVEITEPKSVTVTNNIKVGFISNPKNYTALIEPKKPECTKPAMITFVLPNATNNIVTRRIESNQITANAAKLITAGIGGIISSAGIFNNSTKTPTAAKAITTASELIWPLTAGQTFALAAGILVLLAMITYVGKNVIKSHASAEENNEIILKV